MIEFEKIIILGGGDLAIYCLSIVEKYGISIEFIDCGTWSYHLSDNKHLKYSVYDKNSTFDEISKEVNKTLLISVLNPHIIPDYVIQKENLVAINYHQSLLPYHPGRNAEAWAIFSQDLFSGITWHYVVPKVDAGNIIYQEKIKLIDSMTSIKLFRIQNDISKVAFQKFIPNILFGKVAGYPQDLRLRGVIHYSWDIPNDGRIDLRWDGRKISAFLRSMDYGILKILGDPFVTISSRVYKWKKYSIESSNYYQPLDNILFENETIILLKGSMIIRLIGITTI